MSMSRHVVPSTHPRCSPSRRGKLYPSSQVKESPSTVTPRSRQSSPSGYCNAIMSQPAPDQTAPGPLTVSHDATYHHDKKTPIHLFIAGHTTRAYHHGRGILRTQVILSITLPSRPGETRPPTQVIQVVVVCLHVEVT